MLSYSVAFCIFYFSTLTCASMRIVSTTAGRLRTYTFWGVSLLFISLTFFAHACPLKVVDDYYKV